MLAITGSPAVILNGLPGSKHPLTKLFSSAIDATIRVPPTTQSVKGLNGTELPSQRRHVRPTASRAFETLCQVADAQCNQTSCQCQREQRNPNKFGCGELTRRWELGSVNLKNETGGRTEFYATTDGGLICLSLRLVRLNFSDFLLKIFYSEI